jgi:hypothetical protein
MLIIRWSCNSKKLYRCVLQATRRWTPEQVPGSPKVTSSMLETYTIAEAVVLIAICAVTSKPQLLN